MKYKKLTYDDYKDIVDISKNIWDGNDYVPKIFHKWVDQKEGCFLGLVVNDKVVAIGKYTILKDKQGLLEGLRVHVDYRGMGFANAIGDELFNIAREDLNNGKITNITMCTHKNTVASIKMMEAKDFKLEESCLILFKEYKSIKDENIDINDYKVEKWDIPYEEFKNLDYFKKCNNKITYGFTFYNMCEEIYDELIKENSLVLVNGYRCISKMKGSPSITCIDNKFESINDAANYHLLKYKPQEVEIYINIPYGELIDDLSKNEYQSLNNFENDCLCYIYK